MELLISLLEQFDTSHVTVKSHFGWDHGGEDTVMVPERRRMQEFYESNRDFRDYVEKFRKDHNLTVEEALEHASVREAAKYYREKEIEDEQRK